MRYGYCWLCMSFIGYYKDEKSNQKSRSAHNKHKTYLVHHKDEQ